MPTHRRPYLLLAAAVALIAAAVWVTSSAQRSAADKAFRENLASQRMLTNILEQAAGSRGYALTGDEGFLHDYRTARGEFRRALGEANAGVDDGEEQERRAVDAQTVMAARLQRLADMQVKRVRSLGPGSIRRAEIVDRERLLDRFRRQNSIHQRLVRDERDEVLASERRVSTGLMFLLALLFGGAGHFLLRRMERARRLASAEEAAERRRQSEFVESIQVMGDEREAHGLLKRHLERVIPEGNVTVLTVAEDGERLSAGTEPASGSPLAELGEADPDACLAIRLGKPYRHGAGEEPLLTCRLCGLEGANAVCTPALVSGEVIGSVLVDSPKPLDEPAGERVREAVAQSAPVLANLRTLAAAETRAATDSLTGLANRRAVDETLARMVAQASRTKTPLAAVLMDLDHFKQVNDTYGHGAGDDLLAAMGEMLAATVRASDFVGRSGGEEFIALLPDTDREGARVAAEKLRAAVASVEVQAVPRVTTASLGVAVMPDDAGDADVLLRMADRALYAAKAKGRDRVELAASRHAERTDDPR
jgi:diguanylate cyclase (GGDEF)-like protein